MSDGTSSRTTGLELRLKRTAARIKSQDVAERMGVTPARVSQIEALDLVPDDTAIRYGRALAELIGSPA